MDAFQICSLFISFLAIEHCLAGSFQQGFWREVFTVDVLAPGASLSFPTRSKLDCACHCLQLEDCKTSAFHQHSATCWLYRHPVEYTTTGMASPGTRYFWRLSPSCPGELGYQLEARMCFKVYTTAMNWTTAGKTCRNDGGHLVITDTVEKRKAVLQKANARVWSGGSDQDKEGEWRWVDGTLVEPNNWVPGEPNNIGGIENFLLMYPGGQFNDAHLYEVKTPVCQIPLLQQQPDSF